MKVISDPSRSGLSWVVCGIFRVVISCPVYLRGCQISRRWRVPCHDPRLWIHLLAVQGQLVAGQLVSDNVVETQDKTYYSGGRCLEESDLEVPGPFARHRVS